ncbi:hypothetical protein C3L33_22127, partial [Rhododendron williamsianum]
MCLGKDMAYNQMKSIAASVMERFEFDVQGDKETCPEHLLSLTLRMKGGLPVKGWINVVYGFCFLSLMLIEKLASIK